MAGPCSLLRSWPTLWRHLFSIYLSPFFYYYYYFSFDILHTHTHFIYIFIYFNDPGALCAHFGWPHLDLFSLSLMRWRRPTLLYTSPFLSFRTFSTPFNTAIFIPLSIFSRRTDGTIWYYIKEGNLCTYAEFSSWLCKRFEGGRPHTRTITSAIFDEWNFRPQTAAARQEKKRKKKCRMNGKK
jgi:hypothetical protein